MAPQCNKSEKEQNFLEEESTEQNKIGTDFTFKHQIVWKNLIAYVLYHVAGLVGFLQFITFQVHPLTMIYTSVFYILGHLGVAMGVHRYFSHRAFKATTTMRRVLLILFTLSGQNSLWEWVRNHRQHHKYSDTDADPHNAKRGLFFSHMGWYVSRKNPKVIQYGKQIDMSDLNVDSWVMLQKKHFGKVYILITIFIPCIIPVVLWNEDPVRTFLVCYAARTCLLLNISSLVNSFSHTHGTKPYDKFIRPVDNGIVSLFAMGEGWHNYHHVFPWDYRTSELGMPFNFTAKVIDFCAKMGWVYDRKVATEETIRNRMQRTGDNLPENYNYVKKDYLQ